MRAEVEVDPQAANVRVARDFVTKTLAAWRVHDVVDVAVLLTSELVTNAFLYASGQISIRLDRVEDGIRIQVSDASSAPPQPRTGGPMATSGRGLALVEQLARSWGVEPQPGSGKSIWFEVQAL